MERTDKLFYHLFFDHAQVMISLDGRKDLDSCVPFTGWSSIRVPKRSPRSATTKGKCSNLPLS